MVGAFAGKPKSRKVRELNVWGIRTVGICLAFWTRECVEGKGGHLWERMDIL